MFLHVIDLVLSFAMADSDDNLVWVARQLHAHINASVDVPLVEAITGMMLIIRFLHYLRGFKSTSYLLPMLGSILRQMTAYAYVLLIILVAFTYAFHKLLRQADLLTHDETVRYRFSTWWETLLTVFDMGIVGEADINMLFKGDSNREGPLEVLFVFLMFSVMLVMVNVLIAMLSEVYKAESLNRAAYSNSEHAALLLHFECTMSASTVRSGYSRFWFPKWLHLLKPIDVNELPGETFQDRHRVFKRELAFAKEDGVPDAAAFFSQFNGRALGKKSRYVTRLIEIRGPFVHIYGPARGVPPVVPTVRIALGGSAAFGGSTDGDGGAGGGGGGLSPRGDGQLEMDGRGCCGQRQWSGGLIRHGGFDIADILKLDCRDASSEGWKKVSICYRRAGESTSLLLKYKSETSGCAGLVARLEKLMVRWATNGSSATVDLAPTPPASPTPKKRGGSHFSNPLLDSPRSPAS